MNHTRSFDTIPSFVSQAYLYLENTIQIARQLLAFVLILAVSHTFTFPADKSPRGIL